jgi:class 3 adenylate cyclase/tetratricopeptide (TPR) repeat protein
MTFDDILDQIITLLKRQGRVSYSALKRRFDLDDDYLKDLKDEILYVHPVIDDEGRGLVWTGASETAQEVAAHPAQTPQQPVAQEQHSPQGAPLLTAPPLPDAARRQLTVMFCDVVDSTTLSGQLDPEEYRDVLRAYQAACVEAIQRYDGYIAQHLGDGLLVYFGFPTAHEDDAQRAILAGLGMLDAMHTRNTRLGQAHGVRLSIRVGIHTGLTVIGDIGAGQKHELLALGEAPNIAARIQSLAAPATVVISADTSRLVEGYFTVEDLGRQTLRGVAEPLQVYRVLRHSGAQSRLDIVGPRGLTPLVGREQEVDFLLERWHRVKAGQGQVVLLSGEPGIGKSRLVQVLKDHVTSEPHARLECRSLPHYQHSALYPIIDLLQRLLQWQHDASPDEKLDQLAQALGQYRLPVQETIPLLAPLLSLPLSEDRYPPLTFSPQRQRQKTLEVILAMLLEPAAQRPVLFILEDLHWTDPSTLELLQLLMDQIPTVSFCALLTCRPTFQPPWSSRSYVTQVTLSRLGQPQVERMAEHVAGGKRLPAEVLRQIVEKTDGVPLFVEEMTKAVLESGILHDVNGHYELTGSVSAFAIPATLHDSLMARLDRLGTAKAVAQYAAVLGRHFSYAVLHAVSQLDEPTLQRELGRLVDAELLYQRGLPPQATYLFKHALIRDIAYESLLRSTQQGYHQRVAQVLEAQFPEIAATQPELLAHHYTEAGLNEQAVGYWQKAGQRAIERSAHAEAIRHLTSALGLLRFLPETLEWRRRECEIQTALGAVYIAAQGWGTSNMERAYMRALELGRQMDDPSTLFPILIGLLAIYQVRADYYQAQQQGEELLRLAPRVHDPYALPAAHQLLGEPLMYQGQLAAAHAHYAHVLTSLNPASPRPAWLWFDLRVIALSHQTLTFWLLGYPMQALQRGQEARVAAQELAHPWTSGYGVLLLATCLFYHCHQDSSKVLEGAEALIALADEQGFAALRILGSCWRGWALAQAGQGEEGMAQLREGIAAWEALGGGFLRSIFLGLLAEVYGRTGS